jgi:hypothetical protein
VPLQQRRQRQTADDIAVVNNDPVVLGNQVFNILDAACRIQQDRFMAECYWNAPPAAFRENLGVSCGAVMGIDDKTLHAGNLQMLHRIRDNRPAADGQQRLGRVVGKRP